MKWTNKLFKIVLFIPFFWWAFQIFFGNLGAQPAQTLNHNMGLMALIYLISNLWIGALSAFKFQWPRHLRFLPQERRWLGVMTFVILLGHIFLYFAVEGFEPKAWTQIYTKTYLIFGASAFLTMIFLTLTSNNFSIRKLGGKHWKFLHRIVYVTLLLVTVHIFLIEKADLVLFAGLTFPLWIVQIARFLKSHWGRKK